MKSISRVGLGLSLITACLFLALIAEIFYLFWWKKRFIKRGIQEDYNSPTRDCYIFCWKTSSSSLKAQNNPSHEPESQFWLKPIGDEDPELQNPSGLPKFLFTIKEEAEEFESEDAMTLTPYLTPIASPSFFTSMESLQSHQGFNPFFESSTDMEFSRIRASPPPKMKFLLDAEEKFYRRKVIEENERDGPFVTIVVDNNKGRELNHHCHV